MATTIGPPEMTRDWEGHRYWRHPVYGKLPHIPLGAMHWDDFYALFVGFEIRAGRPYAVYSTREFLGVS